MGVITPQTNKIVHAVMSARNKSMNSRGARTHVRYNNQQIIEISDLKVNPRKHNDFFSGRRLFKVNMPLVLDEHQSTNITVSTVPTQVRSSNQTCKFEVTAADPLQIRNSKAWSNTFATEISVPGSNTMHLRTKPKYKPPLGIEGECVVQAAIAARRIDDEGVVSDSLGCDLFVARRFGNVVRSVWQSTEGLAKNLGGSAVITAITALVGYLVGIELAELLVPVIIMFVVAALLVSVLISWRRRETFINYRLRYNRCYASIAGGD